MTITRCDICKKDIPNRETKFTLEFLEHEPAVFMWKDICLACSAPLAAFLKRHWKEAKGVFARTTLRKCDVCEKELASNSARFSLTRRGEPWMFTQKTICMPCGGTLMAFMRKHGFDPEASNPS